MKYLIDFPKQEASALFDYDTAGNLVKYELTAGTFTPAQFEFLFSKFPIRLTDIDKWKQAKVPNVQIRAVADDLTFERFYKLYDQKFGKKPRAQKLWEALPDTERAKAIAHIQKYNQFLAQTNIAKKNADTYLSQEIWNN
ncbi:MAG TPA: hypothetical protein PLP27_06460 [Crocinitomicaceae bacterium]|nr:hypothetical protein [Crocinitomicaceae bacterium]